jgi:hypothetical protein
LKTQNKQTETERNMSASPQQLRKKRGESAQAFIAYLCGACSNRSQQSRHDRAKPEFVRHCQDLYVRQNGLCSVSGFPMTYGWEAKNPWQISIDRIDNSLGYEIGNVRLVTWFVNNAIGSLTDDILLRFARQLVKTHGMQQPVLHI